jgi:hypothetical protein
MDTRFLRWLALALPLAAGAANAAAIHVTFGGTITYIDPTIADGTFTDGEAVSGSFLIDPDVVDAEPMPGEGSYDSAVTDLSVEFGSYPASAATGYLFIRNGAVQPDEVNVSAEPSGAPVAGLPLYAFRIQLLDTTLAALASDAIPATLDLADFDDATVSLHYFDDPFSYPVYASITSLTYTPVPEPSAASLTALGALLLQALGARRRWPRGRLRGPRSSARASSLPAMNPAR